MAVESCTIDSRGCSGTLSHVFSGDSISERYRVRLAASDLNTSFARNFPAIEYQANATGPNPLPLRGAEWPLNPSYGLVAKSIQIEMESSLGREQIWTVNYLPLEAGEFNTSGGFDNPLLWPASHWIEWVEYEEAVPEAKNVEEFTGAFGRASGTLAPVVNTAYQEFEEGLFKTVRDAVLCIKDNVATLDEVLQIQRDYADTCNSDTVYGVGARRYEFMTVESTGQQNANGVTFYERVIRVRLRKTTDRKMNNVGFKYFLGGVLKDVQGSEPDFLALDGTLSSTPTSVTYRYLDEVPYAALLS